MRKTLFIQRVLLILYVISIAFAPLYFGGERLLSWTVLGILQSLIFLIISLLPSIYQNRVLNAAPFYQTALILFSMIFIWAVIQIIPLPHHPLGHSIWAITSSTLDHDGSASISIIPDESFLTMFKIIIIVLTFLNGVQIFHGRNQEQTLIYSLVGLGTAYAIFGLIWRYISPDTQIWIGPAPYPSVVSSTFVNRNTFAMYMAIHLQICLALILRSKVPRMHKATFTKVVLYNLTENAPKKLVILTAYCLQLTALALTASRAGFIFALVGQISMLLLISASNVRQMRTLSISIPIIIGLSLYVITQNSLYVDSRSMELENNLNERVRLYAEIWSVIRHNPLIGYGLGAFETAFRMDKSIFFDPPGIWHRAHNLYLESFIALGIPATCILVLGWLLIGLEVLKSELRKKSGFIGPSAIAATITVSLHSLFDFGLQSAANAITYAAILGCAISRTRNQSRHHLSRKLI